MPEKIVSRQLAGLAFAFARQAKQQQEDQWYEKWTGVRDDGLLEDSLDDEDEADDEEDMGMAAKTGFRQWSVSDGAYTPVGNTIAKIDPGYYDLAADQNNRLFFQPVRPRTDDLLEFPDSASLSVLNGITEFWKREKIFAKYGLPFKRGIMLYGPPGSGKSCTLQLIARDVVKRGGIVITYPDNAGLFLAGYRALRDIQPKTPLVVLMEDFETILSNSNESRLLNLLDGVESLHKCVFLATTNYPELLKDRIMNRPSRFDLRIRVPHPSAIQRQMYIESLVHPGDELNISRYVADTEGMSLSHLKELFVATHILGGKYDEQARRLKGMGVKLASADDDPDAYTTGNLGGYA